MSNFLTQYQRQPKIYIDLPSQGIFYDETIIQDKQYTEIPVFGMNTMDEIMIKTPDALFSGESTAQIIKSCIPIIKDPWNIIGFDIDYILIAVRIATYGNLMPVSSTCPNCGKKTENDLNLELLLSQLMNNNKFYSLNFLDLRLDLKPLTYKQQTDFSKRQYTFERQIVQIDQTNESDEQKNKQKQEILKHMTQLNAEMTISYIFNIANQENEKTFDYQQIKDFVINNDASIFNDLQKTVSNMNKEWSLPVFKVKCAGEDCGNEYDSSINVDYSNFFGDTSLRSRALK